MAPLTPPEFLLLEYRRTGDARLRDQLVAQHRRLAYSVARRFEGRGEERDDLQQVALIALTHAVERFDPERGLKFATFAVPTIEGALKRHLRDHSWVVRPTRSVIERGLVVAAHREALMATLGRAPTADEVAESCGFTTPQVKQAIHALNTLRRHERESIESSELVDARVPQDEISTLLDRLTVNDLLDELEPRERNIIEMRYFRDFTQAEIATRIRMSNMHVSRLLRRGLETMKHAARENQRQRVA
jgi:RNA polymerase sigma-B factor